MTNKERSFKKRRTIHIFGVFEPFIEILSLTFAILTTALIVFFWS